MIKSFSKAGTKGKYSEEYTAAPDALNADEPADAGAGPTPEALLRRYEQLGKGLWIAMGAGLLIVLWTVAAFVTGPATPSAAPAITGMESPTVPDDNQNTTIQDNLPPQNVEQNTTEPETPAVDNQPQTKVEKPQPRQPARKVPEPATKKVQPETKQMPEQKQQEKTQPDEPTEEQQNIKQQTQQPQPQKQQPQQIQQQQTY